MAARKNQTLKKHPAEVEWIVDEDMPKGMDGRAVVEPFYVRIGETDDFPPRTVETQALVDVDDDGEVIGIEIVDDRIKPPREE